MEGRLRKPAWTPPPVVVAEPWADDPSAAVVRCFERVHQERMAGLPFINERLQVEVIGMQRIGGDWLAALVTPWSVQLLLLPGGGALWRDVPAGTRRRVVLPVGELEFIADAGEAELAAYQYCPLGNGAEAFADIQAAREFAVDALATALQPAAEPAEAVPLASQPPVDLRRRGLLGLRRRREGV